MQSPLFSKAGTLIFFSFFFSFCKGIPDEPGLRSTAWKVLLGYLPPDKRMWETCLRDKRLTYYASILYVTFFKKEM